jgi:dsRNA-specific ribonuclease
MPVSELQELCIKRGIPGPQYQDLKTEGPPLSPLFTIQVVIRGNHSFI